MSVMMNGLFIRKELVMTFTTFTMTFLVGLASLGAPPCNPGARLGNTQLMLGCRTADLGKYSCPTRLPLPRSTQSVESIA